MASFTIAGREFALDRVMVADCVRTLLPEPLHEHYVVVGGRRFPPKQVISCATGLDKADFTTHQARRVLKRLGFTAARVGDAAVQGDGCPEPAPGGAGPQGGRQAAALAPHVGKWVALAAPTDVLVAADTPQQVLEWLARHERRASYGMFRVPGGTAAAEGVAPL